MSVYFCVSPWENFCSRDVKSSYPGGGGRGDGGGGGGGENGGWRGAFWAS